MLFETGINNIPVHILQECLQILALISAIINHKSALLNTNSQKFNTVGAFKADELETLRIQYETPALVQAIMRTALRNDQNAEVHVWLPGSNLGKIGSLLDYFVGAHIVVLENE